MPRLAARVLHDSATVGVLEARCWDPPVGEEKASAAGASHLVLPRRGMFVQHLGGSARRQVVVDPGTALFLNGGDLYRTTHPRGGLHDSTLLRIAPHEAAAAVGATDPAALDRGAASFVHPHGPFPAALALRTERLRAGLRDGSLGGAAGDEEALALLAAAAAAVARCHGVVAPRPDTRTRRQHRELAAAVRERLAAAPTAPHPLTSLSAAFGCSMFHLARIFRRQEGVPIHQYLLRLRLALALQQIADGTPDLARLALDLGFSSHSHFTQQFRRAYGVPPATARGQLASASSRTRSNAAGSSSAM
jgi:AraC family transcriptional regulator